MRSTYASISLASIRHNIELIRSRLKPETKYLAVVKANAYGHGMEAVANCALESGAAYLGVAFAEEGVRLRLAGITAPILLLGATEEDHMDDVIRHDLMPTVFTVEALQLLQTHAAKLAMTCRIHIKADTGMNRIGFTSEAAFTEAILLLKRSPNLMLDGLFTHFAVSELEDTSFTLQQAEHFRRYVEIARQNGLHPLLHASNSAAALHIPEAQFDMVRGGIAMYGCHPAGHAVAGIDLHPVLSWHTYLTHIKTIPAGEGVSYGLKFITPCDMLVGTVAVGYGDGYKRCLSGRAAVLVRGHRAHQIGTICMDQMMVDLTNIPDAAVGDDVVLLGSQGKESITADELAEKADTISYEILLSISERVPRVYTKD
ncbi:Alanine racemase [bioreactor metagenome]|uniref:Alanine racemase n=1 Tax=bioreactor metagenome TaxID=1076179 RepID=A0A645A994_9ZZZZ|nr:alanine racemase [Christensenella sp.]